MKTHIFTTFAGAAILGLLSSLSAADPTQSSKDAPAPETVKATFLITGLHCPPCTATVEKSVKSIKGVKSVKVDWATKNARIEYDEKEVAAQQIASRIASTSHMMGENMQYSGWLSLKVPDVAVEGNAEKAKSALTKLKGVSKVAIYSQQKAVGVEFDSKGTITSDRLIAALKDSGLEASVFP